MGGSEYWYTERALGQIPRYRSIGDKMKAEIKERIGQVRRGEVPEGYRKTKNIGIAPCDWEIGQMSDVLHNEQRPVPKPTEAYWRLGLRSHAKGTFHELIENPDEINMNELYEVKENDLIVNITFAWEHAIALADKADEGLLVSHRFPTYVFDNGNSPHFYKAVVIQKFFKNMLRNISPGGAGRNRVMSKPAFLKLPCYIPPITEQQKIADIINHCDKVIDLKKQLIDEKRRQKEWLMQNLLNPDSGVRLPMFKGSQWKEEAFEELFSFGSSLSASREQLGDKGICYLHYGDIHGNNDYYIDLKATEHMLPKLDINKPASRYFLNDGDVVFVDASEDYDGACKYVVINNPEKIPFISGLHTIPARSKKPVMSILFKQYCFQSHDIKKQFAFYATGMKVLGLNKENLCKITVKFPSLPEQAAIANVLSTADSEIDLLEQELEQWQVKKKSLMQLLLTGLVRVTV